jgi:hypothetical protein
VVDVSVSVYFYRNIFLVFVIICRNNLCKASLSKNFKYFKSIQNVVSYIHDVIAVFII